MKNKNIYIGVVVVVVIALAFFLKTNKDTANQIVDTGFSEERDMTATTTTGAAVILSARTVEDKMAYSRMQSDWAWVKTTYKNAGWAPAGPTKGKDFVLTLNQDKTLSVAGDCNTIKGDYSISENTVSALETEDEMSLGKIKINAVATTKKYCDWSKEKTFLADFTRVSSYDMRVFQLELLLPDGQGTMMFKRVEETQG